MNSSPMFQNIWHQPRSPLVLDIPHGTTERTKWPGTKSKTNSNSEPHLIFVQQLASEKIRQGHFSRRDQETVLVSHQMICLEEVFLELGQLARSFQRAPCYQQRDRHFRIPMLSSTLVKRFGKPSDDAIKGHSFIAYREQMAGHPVLVKCTLIWQQLISH